MIEGGADPVLVLCGVVFVFALLALISLMPDFEDFDT